MHRQSGLLEDGDVVGQLVTQLGDGLPHCFVDGAVVDGVVQSGGIVAVDVVRRDDVHVLVVGEDLPGAGIDGSAGLGDRAVEVGAGPVVQCPAVGRVQRADRGAVVGAPRRGRAAAVGAHHPLPLAERHVVLDPVVRAAPQGVAAVAAAQLLGRRVAGFVVGRERRGEFLSDGGLDAGPGLVGDRGREVRVHLGERIEAVVDHRGEHTALAAAERVAHRRDSDRVGAEVVERERPPDVLVLRVLPRQRAGLGDRSCDGGTGRFSADERVAVDDEREGGAGGSGRRGRRAPAAVVWTAWTKSVWNHSSLGPRPSTAATTSGAAATSSRRIAAATGSRWARLRLVVAVGVLLAQLDCRLAAGTHGAEDLGRH
ncbi:hypothetical protein GS440_19530, partial [Rhodococcus hoagii]|nr:hypothetical protein [Prescottella equi]